MISQSLITSSAMSSPASKTPKKNTIWSEEVKELIDIEVARAQAEGRIGNMSNLWSDIKAIPGFGSVLKKQVTEQFNKARSMPLSVSHSC